MKSTYNMYYVMEPVFFPRQLKWNKETGKLMKTTHVDEIGMRSFNKTSVEAEHIRCSFRRQDRKSVV